MTTLVLNWISITRRKMEKNTNRKYKEMEAKRQKVNEEIKQKIKKYTERNENETQHSQIYKAQQKQF